MWKNIIVRKRHWFMTLLEICVPIALFYLLTYIHGIVQPNSAAFGTTQGPKQIHQPKSESEILEMAFINHDVVNLAYTPDTPFTKNIIANVEQILKPNAEGRPFNEGSKSIIYGVFVKIIN